VTWGNAEMVLEPWAPAELEYQAPAHTSQSGEIGPPGTVHVRGKRTYVYIGCMRLVLLFLVLLLVLILLTVDL